MRTTHHQDNERPKYCSTCGERIPRFRRRQCPTSTTCSKACTLGISPEELIRRELDEMGWPSSSRPTRGEYWDTQEDA